MTLRPMARFHDPPQPTYLLRSADAGQSWQDPMLLGDRMNEGDVLLLSETEWLFAGRGLDLAVGESVIKC